MGGKTIKMLSSAFTLFDDWLQNNRQYLKKQVRSEVAVSRHSDDTDRIAYDMNRLLEVSDFRAQPEIHERGFVYPKVDITYHWQYFNTINSRSYRFVIEPYFQMSGSWIGDKSDNARLQCAQVIFDITALKACELYGIIRTYSFSRDNAVKEFEMQYNTVYKSLENLWDAYIKESDYANNIAKHNEWAIKIRKQLSICACYN